MNTVTNALQGRFKSDMKRGVLSLAVMSRLGEEHYGYSLIRELETEGFSLSQDTLYPLLRRWEDQGIVESEWKMEESRPRRYYKLSSKGLELYEILKEEWIGLDSTIRSLIK